MTDSAMKSEDDLRNKKLTLCLSTKEHQLLLWGFKKTTCRNLGEYIRKMVLSRPLKINIRNQSLDELMAELIKLRSDLNQIAETFNVALDKDHGFNQPLTGPVGFANDRERLLCAIEQINDHITQAAKKWLLS